MDRMDARNQALAERDNREFSNENWERRMREEEHGSGRRFAWFVLVGGLVGLLTGLTTGPAGGWHNPDLLDRLANGGGFALLGTVVGWRLWSSFGIEKD